MWWLICFCFIKCLSFFINQYPALHFLKRKEFCLGTLVDGSLSLYRLASPVDVHSAGSLFGHQLGPSHRSLFLMLLLLMVSWESCECFEYQNGYGYHWFLTRLTGDRRVRRRSRQRRLRLGHTHLQPLTTTYNHFPRRCLPLSLVPEAHCAMFFPLEGSSFARNFAFSNALRFMVRSRRKVCRREEMQVVKADSKCYGLIGHTWVCVFLKPTYAV